MALDSAKVLFIQDTNTFWGHLLHKPLAYVLQGWASYTGLS